MSSTCFVGAVAKVGKGTVHKVGEGSIGQNDDRRTLARSLRRLFRCVPKKKKIERSYHRVVRLSVDRSYIQSGKGRRPCRFMSYAHRHVKLLSYIRAIPTEVGRFLLEKLERPYCRDVRLSALIDGDLVDRLCRSCTESGKRACPRRGSNGTICRWVAYCGPLVILPARKLSARLFFSSRGLNCSYCESGGPKNRREEECVELHYGVGVV